MPVYLKPNPSHHKRHTHGTGHPRRMTLERRRQPGERLTIGLINNMADGALEATERQFVSLLNAASEGLSIDLALYSLPGIPRNEPGSRHMNKFYSSAEDLRNTTLDGLIVTGREPLTQDLREEPYWASFATLLEWARENTLSSIWSCLAAHAATLHMDGVHRIKSNHKRFGVFACELLSDHQLTAGASSTFKVPHSRWNGLPENELTARGYEVLTRAADVDVDTFIKQDKSLFVFVQGHPEYESNTLLLEYRRDVGRYLRNETDTYPLLPRDYFDRDTEVALTALQQQAQSRSREDLLADVSKILELVRIENTWHSTAANMYRNWLQYIRSQKRQRWQLAKLAEDPPETAETQRLAGSIPDFATAGNETSESVFSTH